MVGVLKGWVKLVETSIERVQGDSYCCIYTGERKFINQLNELAKNYPEVDIRYINEDGSVLAYVPFSWFRFVKPPIKRNYTEEQRKAMGERMKRAREKKDECS